MKRKELQSEIAAMILEKSSLLKIDLNSKSNDGTTAFHLACANDHSEIVENILKNSTP